MAPRRLPAAQVEVENPRDFTLARLAIARGSLQAAIEAIDDCVGAFANPESDKRGKDRRELIGDALECTGTANRALEAAEQEIKDSFEAATWQEREPWEDDDEDDEDDEDDDEDDDDDEDEDE